MVVEGSGAVPRSIHALLTAGTFGGLTDGQLIERFVTREGEAAELAFAALMDRHGPMVLRVCRDVLRNEHDAEDAFQATFLILARKARSIQRRNSVAAWLFGVAYHVAVDARSSAARRRSHESEAGRSRPQTSAEATAVDDAPVVREELARLPARYREAVLLCSIEGLTQQQAAERLGLPLGTVQSRLARGRERLRARLARRGLAPASALTWASAESARAAPAALMETTLRGALRFADGKSAGMISAAVAELTQGGLRTMFLHKLRMVAGAVVASLAVATGAGVLARQAAAPDPGDEPKAAKQDPRPAPKKVLDAAKARRLALGALTQAAAIDALPRFSYQASYRHGEIESTKKIDESLDGLQRALSEPVLDKDWIGWYELGFSWDETRFLWELRPGEAGLNYDYRFGTRTDAWARHEAKDKSSVHFTRATGPAGYWKHQGMFDFSYLRVAPHRYWWGRTAFGDQSMSLTPPQDSSWMSLGTETFGGEPCDVLDSVQRGQRLWIGRNSGRLRGVLRFDLAFDFAKSRNFYASEAIRRIAGRSFESQLAYGDWFHGQATDDQMIEIHRAWIQLNNSEAGPNLENAKLQELVAFDDYREVAQGIWIPFRETRAFPHWSSTLTTNKRVLRRSELRVEEVRTDRVLADRFAELTPKEGDPVQDQRFMVPIDTKYSAKTGDDEIRKRAEIEYAKRLEGRELLKKLVEPVAAMVGKPAPALPAKGWIGGEPPDVAGKPYLLHFWATWCGPCKNDLPRLKTLADRGAIIVGMHPSGTPAEEVEKAIRDEKFGGPTFLETEPMREAGRNRINGFDAGVFPYYVLVDAQGRVAGHGSLSEILDKFGPSLIAKPEGEDARKRPAR